MSHILRRFVSHLESLSFGDRQYTLQTDFTEPRTKPSSGDILSVIVDITHMVSTVVLINNAYHDITPRKCIVSSLLCVTVTKVD